MFNVVLPAVMDEFHINTSQVSWIITSYFVIYAVGTIIYGKLADQYRLKDLLTLGLSIFAFGSVIGLTAVEFWMVVAGRIFQAVGASVIPATAMLIPVRYFSVENRGKALGMVSTGISLGVALGPVFAGFVATFANWRFLFLLSIVTMLTLPFYRKYLDNDRGEAGKTDILGGVLVAGTVSLLLLSVTQEKISLFIAGVILFALSGFRFKYAQNPFIKLALFQNRNFLLGILVAFLSTGRGFGSQLMTPIMLTELNQLAPAVIGVILFPGALVAALLGKKGGQLADQKGNAFLIYLAVILTIVAFSVLSLGAGMSPMIVLVCLTFVGVGQAYMMIGMSNTLSQTLPTDLTGIGMSFYMMSSHISGAVFSTMIGKMLDLKVPAVQLNPLLMNSAGKIYSNIFLILAIIGFLILIIYRIQFGKQRQNDLNFLNVKKMTDYMGKVG